MSELDLDGYEASLARQAKRGGVSLDVSDIRKLIAAARELERLKSAFRFMTVYAGKVHTEEATRVYFDARDGQDLIDLFAEALAAAEHRGASTRALELEQLRAAVTEAVTELGKWQQRTHMGDVCWPQLMHDGTLRIYASVTGKTPKFAQGRDFLTVVQSLCARLGIALKLAHPELPDEPKETT